MRSTLESTLPWWIAGPALGLVIVALLGLANKRFGVLGGVNDLVSGVGWGISDACPGPIAGQFGGGRLMALAVAGGVLAGVKLQPRLVTAAERLRRAPEDQVPAIQGADVL